VKYARPGVPPVIEVSAERRCESWRLSVRDNGIGISAGDRDLVFGLFNRVETSVDGSGIGLATVKRIIEAHGGTIGISSVEGPGTDVWFELPAAARGPDEPAGSPDARRVAEPA
jgi:signal transduction histidine kinase